MKVDVVASTVHTHGLELEKLLRFSGIAAGVCYMPDNFHSLCNAPDDKIIARVQNCIKNGHHSVLDHVHISLVFTDIPKIIAMILNNEKVYTTSEKSARYTKMQPSEKEQQIYEKWIIKFEDLITKTYPQIPQARVHKLALENARYFISVFTPATTMLYTVSLRQINYIRNWVLHAASNNPNTPFFVKLQPHLLELAEKLRRFDPAELAGKITDQKNRGLSLFAKSNYARPEYFCDTYCVNYYGSFAELA